MPRGTDPTPPPGELDWPVLAAVIRRVDGRHDLGAGDLAEAILAAPEVVAALRVAPHRHKACPDCGHNPHGDGDDLRCGAIIGSDGHPMPEPLYCGCLRWEDVTAFLGRMTARVSLSAAEGLAAEYRKNLWDVDPHEGKYGDDGQRQCGGVDFLTAPMAVVGRHLVASARGRDREHEHYLAGCSCPNSARCWPHGWSGTGVEHHAICADHEHVR